MKTLTRTIITLTALSILATAFAQAQTSQLVTPSPAPSQAPPAPATPTPPATPVIPTPPTLPSSSSVDFVVNDLSDLLNDLSWNTRSDTAGTVLVIPSEQTTAEDLITINEDMNVMTRIFEKNLEQERITTVSRSMFISDRYSYGTLLGSSRGRIQSMYLQGFGALFLMKVDFPLTPPSDVQEKQQESQKAEEGDPVWRQIRQEMYEPQKVERRRKTDRLEEKYDAEKVENLKTTLIKTLKHAANIQCLKPDESVILTVIGKGGSIGTTITAARVLPGENQIIVQEKTPDGKMITKLMTGNALDDVGLSSPVILVIRTKKSDIDGFAKGDLDFEMFRQRVQLLTYPLLGGVEGENRNLFDDYYRARSTGSSNMR